MQDNEESIWQDIKLYKEKEVNEKEINILSGLLASADLLEEDEEAATILFNRTLEINNIEINN